MIHNFTQESHSNVSQFFVAINPDTNDQVITLAQQFRSKHSRVLARIGGSGLVDSIIREHSRMASVKRSARQQIDAVFSHMAAADIPYGQNTLCDLNSVNSLITVFLNALGIAAFDVKTSGIDNIDRSVRYLASAGVTSGVHWTVNNTIDMRAESLKAQINALVDAANKGYGDSEDSSDSCVKDVHESVKNAIQDLEKTEKRELSDNEKDNLFAKACYTTAIIKADEYGKDTVAKIDHDATINTFEYLRYSNFTTTPETRKMINNNRTDPFKRSIIAAKSDNPMCAGYIYNAVTFKQTNLPPSPLGQYLMDRKAKDGAVGNTTTPQFAALSGGITRTSKNPKNDGLLAPTVKAVVSISNHEDITIKIPGSKDYISLEGSKRFNYLEQWDILKESKAVNANDILYIGNGKNDRYIDMHHVVAMDSPETCSSQNEAFVKESVYEKYIKKNIEKTEHNTTERLYFVLLNSDEAAIQEINNQYP